MKTLPTILVAGAMTFCALTYLAVPLKNPISTATAAVPNSPEPRQLPAFMTEEDYDVLRIGMRVWPDVIPARAPYLYLDGDTFDVIMTPRKFWEVPIRIRVRNINAPESRSPKCTKERDLARQATEFVKTTLSAPGAVIAVTNKGGFDKEGRYLAQISVNGKDLGEMMMNHDPVLARPWTDQYEGQQKTFWCTAAAKR